MLINLQITLQSLGEFRGAKETKQTKQEYKSK